MHIEQSYLVYWAWYRSRELAHRSRLVTTRLTITLSPVGCVSTHIRQSFNIDILHSSLLPQRGIELAGSAAIYTERCHSSAGLYRSMTCHTDSKCQAMFEGWSIIFHPRSAKNYLEVPLQSSSTDRHQILSTDLSELGSGMCCFIMSSRALHMEKLYVISRL